MAETALVTFGSTSIQYTLMHGENIILSGTKGVYDRSENSVPDRNTMYGIGSVSKLFVTAAGMLLADKGILDIDRPIIYYLPDFKMADRRYVKIASKHLMNHSSGIYGTHFRNSLLFEDSDTYAHDSLLNNLESCSLKYDPGSFSEYCNDGFSLLEILVERLSGMRYNEFLKKFFFTPLDMKSTKTPLDNFDRTLLARACLSVYDGTLPYETTNIIGTGGLYSTTEDLCKFGKALSGGEILSKVTAGAMGENEYQKGIWPEDEENESIYAYGLGWDNVHLPPFNKYGIKALFKDGNTIQYHSSLVCIPEYDMTAAVISAGNRAIYHTSFASTLSLEVLKELKIIKKIIPEKAFSIPIKTEIPDEITSFSGFYAENGKIININIKNGEFILPTLLPEHVPEQKYIYSGKGIFNSLDGKVSVHFVKVNRDLAFMQANIAISFNEIGNIIWKCFKFQRLAENKIDNESAAVRIAWENRKNAKYLILDEKFSSQRYLSLKSPTTIDLQVNLQIGYAFGGCRIINENFAKNELYFRDATDLRFFKKNGIEYLHAKGNAFIRYDCIPSFDITKKDIIILDDGYVRYFRIQTLDEGVTIHVNHPKGSALAVYDGNFEMKNLTTISKNKNCLIVKGDLIAFIGSPGDKFEIT
ncbi:MAG: beta-lactamase family protein [Treponema sp.]|nr:beta-lactamase family protein [Treponema sp.]